MVETVARVSGPNEEDLSPDEQEEILSQNIRTEIGGKIRTLPIRKIAEERAWMDLVLEKAHEVGETNLDLTAEGYTSLMRLGSEAILDLVLAYDHEGSLGGREYVEKVATRREIYSLFRRLLEEHFPFSGDLVAILERMQGIQGALALARLATSRPEKSGSGSVPSGNRAERRSRKA